MLRTALRFIAGAAAGIAIWWYATPAYNEWLAAAARVELRWDKRITGAAIEPRDRAIVVRPGTAAPGIEIPADQLTYNIVLFAGLIAAIPPRRIWRGLAALIVLLAFHAIAAAITIESTYATRAGAWSEAHYIPIAQNFWSSLDFMYRLGGMFAVAFVCWYAATWSPAREPQRGTTRKSARAQPSRPRAAKSGR